MEMCDAATRWAGKHHLSPSDPHHSASGACPHCCTSGVYLYHKVTGPWGSPGVPKIALKERTPK